MDDWPRRSGETEGAAGLGNDGCLLHQAFATEDSPTSPPTIIARPHTQPFGGQSATPLTGRCGQRERARTTASIVLSDAFENPECASNLWNAGGTRKAAGLERTWRLRLRPTGAAGDFVEGGDGLWPLTDSFGSDRVADNDRVVGTAREHIANGNRQ
jgi:hypothetical protein